MPEGTDQFLLDQMTELYEKNPGLVQALAEEDNRVRDELVKAGSTDGLTGLHSRDCLYEMVPKSLDQVKRHPETEGVLLFIDVDGFKQINDTHGHQVGDEVLRAIGRSIKKGVRQADFASRYGGEEFVIYLHLTDLAGAELAAERIRRAVEALEVETQKADEPLKITISVGCASTKNIDDMATLDSKQILESLVKKADQCLYQAKRMGKNRVVVDGKEK